jgi:opacity protein-like surface antigen
MGAAFLIAPLAAADIPRPGGYTENVDGYLRIGAGLGLSLFSADIAGTTADSPTVRGVALEGAAGLTFNDRLRWDVLSLAVNLPDEIVNVGGVPAHLEGTRLDMSTGVAFGDFSPDRKLHPFVHGGLGLFRYSDPGVADADWGFAWNAGAGLEYQLMNNLAVGPRYTFRHALADFNGVEADFYTHEFTLTFTWGGTQ